MTSASGLALASQVRKRPPSAYSSWGCANNHIDRSAVIVRGMAARCLRSVSGRPASQLDRRQHLGPRAVVGQARPIQTASPSLALHRPTSACSQQCVAKAFEAQAVDTAVTTHDSNTLNWTATGDDGDVGQATLYTIRYSVGEPMTEDTWDDLEVAKRMRAVIDPYSVRFRDNLLYLAEAGTAETLLVSDLAENTTYYFGIKARDDRHQYLRMW